MIMDIQTELSEPNLTDVIRSHNEIQKILRAEIASQQFIIEAKQNQIEALLRQVKEAGLLADGKLQQQITVIRKQHAIELHLQHALYHVWRDGPMCGVPEFFQQIDTLSASGLFDVGWYLKTYPDVAESGMSAQEHYIKSGAFEGRNPGPNFSSMEYYLANPDVAEMGWPALVHYALFGQAEGRSRS